MKLGITRKLVLVLLASSILLVVAMALSIRWSFHEGFLNYLGEAELATLDDMVEDLANAYRREGDWQFLRANHRGWARFLPLGPDGRPIIPAQPPAERNRFNPPPRDLGRTPPPMRRPPPPAPTDKSGLSTRLRLLDENKQRVIGPPDNTGKAILRPIELDGDVIGWLSLSPLPVPSSTLDQKFRHEQLNAIYPTAVGALLLALIFGIPLGKTLLRPIKELTRGTRALTKGKYETRLEPKSKDELGQVANDFNILAKALERNEMLRRHGMADISHELRTPLGLLRGEIEAMQDNIRPTDEQQLNKLHNSIMQLNRLVDDLYDLALSDAGALSYRKDQLSLSDLILDAAEDSEPKLQKHGLQIKTNISPDLMVFGDSRRLRQVIDNLLKNSRRYTDAGGYIQINARQQGDMIEVTLEDTAPGINPEHAKHLFERFYREEGSRNRASGGAGLGLPICKNIIEAHQGKITGRPSSLGGLHISIILPTDQ